jgi:hypothetical protein
MEKCDNMSEAEIIYDYALVNWETGVGAFLLFVDVVCGYDKGSELYKSLERAVTSVMEIGYWENCYDGSFDEIEETTEKYLKCRENRNY